MRRISRIPRAVNEFMDPDDVAEAEYQAELMEERPCPDFVDDQGGEEDGSFPWLDHDLGGESGGA